MCGRSRSSAWGKTSPWEPLKKQDEVITGCAVLCTNGWIMSTAATHCSEPAAGILRGSLNTWWVFILFTVIMSGWVRENGIKSCHSDHERRIKEVVSCVNRIPCISSCVYKLQLHACSVIPWVSLGSSSGSSSEHLGVTSALQHCSTARCIHITIQIVTNAWVSNLKLGLGALMLYSQLLEGFTNFCLKVEACPMYAQSIYLV